MAGLMEHIEAKKGIVLSVIGSLIIVALAAAFLFTAYPELLESQIASMFPGIIEEHGIETVYAVVALTAFIVVDVILLIAWAVVKMVIEGEKALGDSSKEDVKAVLQAMDGLLGKLPEAEVEKFMKSKDAELYKSVLEEYGVE